MSHLYLDNLSRRNANNNKIAGRGNAIMVEPKPDLDQVVFHYCNKPGHYQRGCALFSKDKNKKSAFRRGKADPGSSTEKNWCSIHHSTSHNDVDCYKQRALRPQEGSSDTTATLNSNTELKAGEENDPDLNKELNFDGGFMWMALSDGRSVSPTNSKITMLVDSGTTENFVDDELISERKEKMLNHIVLNTKIRAAGKQAQLGTATGILSGVITDKAGDKHEVSRFS